MGLFDFVKKGAQEMFIARPDEAKDLLVYKWPDRTIPTMRSNSSSQPNWMCRPIGIAADQWHVAGSCERRSETLLLH